MEPFIGCIIDESLADTSVVQGWTPFAEKIVAVPEDPDATVWHVKWYQLEETALLGRLDALAAAMLPTWYGHFWSGNSLCVIFAGRIFWLPITYSSEWEEMIEYGESLGIERGWTSNIPTMMPDWVAAALPGARPVAPAVKPQIAAPVEPAPERPRPSGEARSIGQVLTPSTRNTIAAELRAGGLRPGMRLLVHSRLSSIGWVAGGPVGVIQALQDVLTSEGTLVMPAFTGDLSDPSHWSRPPVPEDWWPTIRQELPAFDPLTTPTRSVGAIPELFRTWPGVRRSNHPQASFSAWGRDAYAFTADHQLEQGLGEESPLGRLYDADAWILFLGTNFETCTPFHLSEHRSGVCFGQTQAAPVMTAQGRRWQEWETLAYDDSDFPLIGLDYQIQVEPGDLSRFKIGAADCLLMRMRPLVDFGAAWIREQRVRGA